MDFNILFIGMGVFFLMMISWLFGKYSTYLSQAESALIEKMYQDETKLKTEFLIGKEKIINQWESIKSRIDTLEVMRNKSIPFDKNVVPSNNIGVTTVHITPPAENQ